MKLVLKVKPVPASRPRISRRGFAYYGKTYEAFRNEMRAALKKARKPQGCPLLGPLAVKVRFFCIKPKKVTMRWPKGDLDNYVKAILDSLNGWAWEDDSQIIWLEADKQYSDSPRLEIEWKETDGTGIGVRSA